MKLTTMTQISIDGVMQGNGGSEDPRDGFRRGGWALGKADEKTRTHLAETYQRAGAFLFGRRTFQLFASSWGTQGPMSEHPIGRALNTKPKFVVSRTLTSADWADSTILGADLNAEITALKESPGGELQVHGSGELVRWLLAHDLIDEMTLIVIPVIVGQGFRLFPENGSDHALELIESHVDTKGVSTQIFRPAGRPEYA